MTTKQIADAVSKDESTVRRWVRKSAGKIPAVKVKMTAAGHGKPADYTLDETCSIIEAGMGRNAAGIFRANAENRQNQNGVAEIATIVRETVAAMVPAIIAAIKGSLPESSVPALPAATELSYRDQLRRMINKHAYRTGASHSSLWRDLYSEYYYRYHRNLRECAKNREMDTIEYADLEGLLPELLALAVSMYGVAA